MIHSAIVPAAPALPDTLVFEAVRLWRGARDAGDPPQPALHALLEPQGHAMLAPLLDSVLLLCECRFDRTLCAGCPLAPSGDERMLCRLLALDGLPCGPGSAGIDRALRSALASARFMLRQAAMGDLQ